MTGRTMKRFFPNGIVLTWELSCYGWVLIGRSVR